MFKRIDEQFVHQMVDKAGGLPAIDESVKALKEYGNGAYYKSKNNRLNEWYQYGDPNMYKLVISVFTTALVHKELTYQAMVGALRHNIPVVNTIDQVKIIAEVIAVIGRVGLLKITRQGPGKSIMIAPGFNISEDIPQIDKHKTVMCIPTPVTKNFDPIQKNMILGESMNHHSDNICLEHLNSMNSIPLEINKEFIQQHPETTEKIWDRADKQKQWDLFVEESREIYNQVIQKGNKFYLCHKPDTRGRCYAQGYYITTQGSSYKKAMIELYNKEIVEI